MKFNFFVFFVLSNLIFSEVDFLDRIAIIVDEGIIMESEVNDALEQTINNFVYGLQDSSPTGILFKLFRWLGIRN